jgi:hypothetical protein
MPIDFVTDYCKKNDFIPEIKGNKVIFTIYFGNRSQTCEAYMFLSQSDGRKVLKISSKVGKFKDMHRDKIHELMIDITDYIYARPELDNADGTLTISACILDEYATAEEVEFLIFEVAKVADQFENKFFHGRDVY